MAKQKDVIRQIKKATRRQFSTEEKIRIVLEGSRGETAISEICRREGIASNVYYKWSKAFLEAGKNWYYTFDAGNKSLVKFPFFLFGKRFGGPTIGAN